MSVIFVKLPQLIKQSRKSEEQKHFFFLTDDETTLQLKHISLSRLTKIKEIKWLGVEATWRTEHNWLEECQIATLKRCAVESKAFTVYLGMLSQPKICLNIAKHRGYTGQDTDAAFIIFQAYLQGRGK